MSPLEISVIITVLAIALSVGIYEIIKLNKKLQKSEKDFVDVVEKLKDTILQNQEIKSYLYDGLFYDVQNDTLVTMDGLVKVGNLDETPSKIQ